VRRQEVTAADTGGHFRSKQSSANLMVKVDAAARAEADAGGSEEGQYV
jgi:hypothetical protein